MSQCMLDNWKGKKLEAKVANVGFEQVTTRFRLNFVTTDQQLSFECRGYTNLYYFIYMDMCHPQSGWGGLRLLILVVVPDWFTCI